MSEFKIGDRVIISKVFSDDPQIASGQNWNWIRKMDETIGLVGEIIKLGEEMGFKTAKVKTISKEKIKGLWTYHLEALTIFNPTARADLINKIKERNKK